MKEKRGRVNVNVKPSAPSAKNVRNVKDVGERGRTQSCVKENWILVVVDTVTVVTQE